MVQNWLHSRRQTHGEYMSFLDLVTSLGAIIGVLVGLGAALVVHWFAPPGVDTVSLGAWLVFFGWLAGALVDWIVLPNSHRK